MLNDALIHGFKRLPDLQGPAFIFSICGEINRRFPSLPFPILPIHIDDAHPLRTRRKTRKKVVIIRFSNRWVKDILMSCAEDLEGTGLLLTEHLSGFTLRLRSETAKIVGADNTETRKSKVYAKRNGVLTVIRNQNDLDNPKLSGCGKFAERGERWCHASRRY